MESVICVDVDKMITTALDFPKERKGKSRSC